MDRSVEVYEMTDSGGKSPDASNGKLLVSEVYALEGKDMNEVASFDPVFSGPTMVWRVPLERLGVKAGAKVRGLLKVGFPGHPVHQPPSRSSRGRR